ncbi:MAG: tyrosine-type recombinase/integrase [Bacilli bacterium]
MRVKACAELWMNQVAENINAGSTIDDKKSKLTNHILPYMGEDRMCDVNRERIQGLINTLKKKDSQRHDSNGKTIKLSSTTIKNIYSIVRAMFAWAADEDINIIEVTPCRKIYLPEVDEYDKEVFDTEEIDRLLDAIIKLPIQRQCLYLIPLFCGLRRGEVAGLRWKDIDFEHQKIHIRKSLSITKSKGTELKKPKSKKDRTTGMNDWVKDSLLQLKEEQRKLKTSMGKFYKDSEMVFTDEYGGYLTPNAIMEKIYKET